MPALLGQKRFLTFKGVGKGIFNDLSGTRIFDVIKGQEVKLGWENKTKDLEGGDAAFPYGTMITSAAGSVDITEGTLDMNVFQAQTNNAVQYGVSATAWAIDEQTVIPATPFTYSLLQAATIVATVDPIIRFLDGTGTFTKVASAPATTQYSIVAGLITFAAADTGKSVTIDYQYTVATADVATATSTPGILYGTYIHTVKYMNPVTAVEGLGQLVVYRCAYDGKNELAFKRADAAQPKVNLKIFDPMRADKKVFDVLRIS